MSTRTELEKDLYDWLDDMDPSGKNTTRMKNFLVKMSDKEFYQYFDKYFNDPDMFIGCAYEPMNNPVNVQFIESIAKKHNIKLYERVYKPFLTGDTNDPPGTVYDILVVDYPIKRLKQMVFKKSHTSVSNTKRDARTGQVTGDNKTARVTDAEAFSLIVQELYNCAEAYYGPMSDDTNAQYEMMRLIQRDGEVSLKDLPKDPTGKTTMNTINYYMLGSCISTNLIEQTGYVLPATMKEDEAKVIDRG